MFLIVENPKKIRKISRFGELFENSIFSPLVPQGVKNEKIFVSDSFFDFLHTYPLYTTY
jgi:hypothetical protein